MGLRLNIAAWCILFIANCKHALPNSEEKLFNYSTDFYDEKDLCDFPESAVSKYSHHLLFNRRDILKSYSLGYSTTQSLISKCIIQKTEFTELHYTAVCSADFTNYDIYNLRNYSQILDLDCGSVKKDGDWVDQNKCICVDFHLNNGSGLSQLPSAQRSSSKNNSDISVYKARCKNNTITITSGSFQGQDLHAIYFSHSNISIAPKTFDQLPSLEFISFEDNRYSSSDLPPGLFCKNKHLRIFHAEEQNFQDFPAHLFKCPDDCGVSGNLPRLTKVIVENCHIENIPLHPLGCAKNVSWLILSRNKINDITNLCTSNLASLEGLVLLHNYITLLKPFGFRNLRNLDFLDLRHNLLNILKSVWFLSAVSLKVILLDNNLIKELEGSFAGLTKLTHLLLSNNKLSTIQKNVLNGSRSLEWLDLHSNNLNDLEFGSLSDLDNLVYLNASNNKLNSLQLFGESFSNNAHHLQYLELQNNEIFEVNKTDLKPYPWLLCLVLSHNNIQEINLEAFDANNFIYSLILEKNQISSLQNWLSPLKNLEKVYLSNNKIIELRPHSFQGLTKLEYMKLSQNCIRRINNQTFTGLIGLKEINLSHNCIENIENIVFPKEMTVLHLINNSLVTPPCFTEGNKVKVLLMDYNKVTSLKAKSFCNLQNLGGLSLTNNNMEFIEPRSFDDASELQVINLSFNKLKLNFSIDHFQGTALKTLLLHENNISSVESLLFQQSMQRVVTIYLSYNPITEVPAQPKLGFHGSKIYSSLQVLNLQGCQIKRIDRDAFKFMVAKKIILSGNNLTDFPELNIGDTSPDLTIDLFNNPIICSCKMRWLRRSMSYEGSLTTYSARPIYNLRYCYYPVNDSVVEFHLLSEEDFLCPTDYTCHTRLCNCWSHDPDQPPTLINCTGRQSKKLPSILSPTAQVVYLHGNRYEVLTFSSTYPSEISQARKMTLNDCAIREIKPDSFQHFRNLNELYLHNNMLQSLHKGLFSPLAKLKLLTLQNNMLQTLESDFLLHNMIIESITLHNNSLSILTKHTRRVFADMFYLNTLSLYDNPWICKCDNNSWKSWLIALGEKLDFPSKIECYNGSSVLATPDDVFICPNITNTYVKHSHGFIALATLSVVLPSVIFITMFLVYFHRHLLAVHAFSLLRLRFKRSTAENCQYDAIFIYDDDPTDDNYSLMTTAVVEIYEWLTSLNPPYKVMVPHLHMDPGPGWTEEVGQAIHFSKKTAVFITEEFIQKQKTMFLFDSAYNVMIERRSNDIILVVDNKSTLKYIRSKANSDARLKALVQSNNYVILKERLFHKKVLYLLPEIENSKALYDNNSDTMQLLEV